LKQVEAIVASAKLNEVRASLARAGVDGMTVVEVLGFGTSAEPPERSAEHKRAAPRVKVKIVVEDGRVPALVQELLRAVRTGRVGDGKIFVLPVDDAVRIRTSERGRDAL